MSGERKRATGKERKRREEERKRRERRIGKGGREAKEKLGDQNEKWAQIRGTHTCVRTHRHTGTHTHMHAHIYIYIHTQGPCMHVLMHTQTTHT